MKYEVVPSRFYLFHFSIGLILSIDWTQLLLENTNFNEISFVKSINFLKIEIWKANFMHVTVFLLSGLVIKRCNPQSKT